ncbi:hypothetical protein [Aureimonas sp. AU22]|jgi:hypothetical protein|uniref:hypothetical protein n=1 Tax=Aureimonas sp. AU22 TaxID=1638162 RepID=UPI000A9479C0|nr:hypothetical protein [Aureimonas sp. AU22]
MSAMEDSLRRALQGGDASDPAFRESIYAASERALERMLETRGADAAEVDAQRAKLAETIDRVEADHADWQASDPVAEAEAERGFAPDARAADDAGRDAPDAPRAPRAFEPTEAADDPVASTWTPGGERPGAEPVREARSPRSVLIAAVVFALVLALLAYFIGGMIRGSGPDSPAAQNETSALDWITVFDGDDLESLSTPAGGRIEAAPRSGGRDAVRVSGPTAGEGEVLMAIGPGVVGEIAGSNVRIEVTAGSPDGTQREFSVRCLFGGTSLCERQRFSTTMSEEAFIFDVPVPADARSPASIAIGPGVNGTTNDVDVFSLRLRRVG